MANLANAASIPGNSLNNAGSKAKPDFSSGIGDPNTEPRDMLHHLGESAMGKATEYYVQGEKYVRRNPFYFIGGAVVIGCMAGMLLARKH